MILKNNFNFIFTANEGHQDIKVVINATCLVKSQPFFPIANSFSPQNSFFRMEQNHFQVNILYQ